MGNSKIFSQDWIEEFQGAVNRDAELSWIAKHMNCKFIWKIGDDHSFIFQIEGGKVTSIAFPTWNDSWDFSIEGPIEVWLKFTQIVPPPIYNDLLGIITRIPDCTLNGNRLMAMQYMRSLTRMFNIAREIQGGEEE